MAATFALEIHPIGAGAFEPTAFEPTAFAVQANAWLDITADVVDTPIQITRGFQSNAPDDLVAAPPTLSFALNNSARNLGGVLGYYSPDSANVRAGWVIGMPVRFKVTANGTTRIRFQGWLDVITPTTGLFEDQTVACVAVGWLAHASTALVTGLAAQIAQRGDQLLTTLLSVVPFAPIATSFAVGLDTFPYAFDDLDPSSAVALDGIDSIVRSGFDRVYEKADGTLVYESRAFRETTATNALVLTDAAPDATHPGLALTQLPVERRRDKIRNRFQVTVHPKRVDASAVVLYALQVSGSAQAIAPGASVTINGNYVDPNQVAQQVGGFNMLIRNGGGSGGGSTIGTSGNLPTADYDFGSAAGLTDLSGSMSVAVSYAAGQATFTVTNGSMTQAAYYTKLQCRGQGIYDYQTVVATAADATSQAAAGQVTVTLDCPYTADASFADAASKYAVNLYAPTLTQLDQGVGVEVNATDELSLDALLALEISSAIGITETMSGLVAGNYWINATTETYDERCNAALTFALTPRDPNTYFTVDVSTIDGPDALAAI
jgi:hypothetical protein